MKTSFLLCTVLFVLKVFEIPLNGQQVTPIERLVLEKEEIVSQLAEEVVDLFEKRSHYLKNCSCSQHLCLNDATGFTCQTRLGNDPVVCGSNCKGRRIGYEWSAFKTPPDTPLQDMEPRLKEAICLYANLEPKMKELITEDKGNFLYFSGIEGHQRIYPVLARHRGLENGDKELNGCVKYDPRIRPWFMAASTRPKDIVLVIDASASMTDTLTPSGDQSRWDITREAVISILDTLTPADYVNIVTFSDSASRLITDSSLLKGIERNLKILKNEIRAHIPHGSTNFDSAFREAFDILTNACNGNPETQSCSNCQKVILFLTDGRDTTGPNFEGIAATEMLRKIEKYQRRLEKATDTRASIFTFSMGEESDDSIPRQIACANSGSWSYIGSETDPLTAMAGYYHFLTNPSNDNSPVWVEPYLGAGGQGNITTVSKAVFSKGTDKLDGIFLGVVGMTVLLRDLEVPGYPYQDVLDALTRRQLRCGATRQSECQLQVHRNAYANSAICADNISSDKSASTNDKSQTVSPCYRGHNYKFYKLFFKKTTWRKALGQCRRDGGQLATVQSDQELAFIAGVSSPDWSWIGARLNMNSLRWEWIDRKLNRSNLAVTSSYWATHEPDNYRRMNEECVQIDRRGASGNLNDRNCNVELSFICEYKTARNCDSVVTTPTKNFFSVPPLDACVHEELSLANGQPLTISRKLTTEDVMCPIGEPAHNTSVICCKNCKKLRKKSNRT